MGFLEDIVFIIYNKHRKKTETRYTYLPDKTDPRWELVANTSQGFSEKLFAKFCEVPSFAFLCMWYCFKVGEKDILQNYGSKLTKILIEIGKTARMHMSIVSQKH